MKLLITFNVASLTYIGYKTQPIVFDDYIQPLLEQHGYAHYSLVTRLLYWLVLINLAYFPVAKRIQIHTKDIGKLYRSFLLKWLANLSHRCYATFILPIKAIPKLFLPKHKEVIPPEYIEVVEDKPSYSKREPKAANYVFTQSFDL